MIKGAVGFAMPMILISGLGSLMAPELALAGLMIPTLVTNLWQGLRQGLHAALEALRDHRVYIIVVLVMIALSAQLVSALPDRVMFLAIGVPIMAFSLMQLAGWRLRITAAWRRIAEVGVALGAGFVGGLSGVWGPPTVIYLTALDIPKQESVRVQGVVYGVGAVVLALAHVRSGVLTPETGAFSAVVCLPALLGMALGLRLQDRMDQDRFRRITLFVLVLAGANLVRRGLLG